MSTGCESWTVESPSETRTRELGERLGRLLQSGDVVALVGPLGAGKTYFVKGIARGMGVEDVHAVRSPTFILVNEYAGRVKLYHVDAYRLRGTEDLDSLGVGELLHGEGVTVVEWADRVKSMMPAGTLWVTLRHVSPLERELVFEGTDGRGRELVEMLRKG